MFTYRGVPVDVLFSVIQEITVNLVIIGILVPGCAEGCGIETENVRAWACEEDRGVRGDDELGFSRTAHLTEQLKEGNLHPGGERVLGFIEKIQPPDPEPGPEIRHMTLAVRLRDQRFAPERNKYPGIGCRPLVEDTGEVLEVLRGKERPRHGLFVPFDSEAGVQGILEPGMPESCPTLILPDMDVAGTGNGTQKGGLSGPVVAGKESYGLRKVEEWCRAEDGKAERVFVVYRELLAEDMNLFYVHGTFRRILRAGINKNGTFPPRSGTGKPFLDNRDKVGDVPTPPDLIG